MKLVDNVLATLYKTPQSVFTSKEIAILIGESRPEHLRLKLSYYVKTGGLVRLRKGIFAKGKDFEPKECIVRVYTQAYVSFETVLAAEGVIFQYYASLFAASYLSRSIACGGQKMVYRKLKDSILLNRRGVVDKGTYRQAGRERAFLDTLYLNSRYPFDNLRNIDWERCFDLAPIYKNKALLSTLKRYYKEYAQ